MKEIKAMDVIKRQREEIAVLNKTINNLNRQIKKRDDVLAKINGLTMRLLNGEQHVNNELNIKYFTRANSI